THVSDQARHALDDWRSPRISGHGLLAVGLPFSSTCAERAGKNVLKTPIGRLFMPGAIVSTNGSMPSDHVMRMRSFADVIVATAVARASPDRANCAAITGVAGSANSGNRSVSIVRCSQRATSTLSA